jgi:hypothetical protein
MNLEGSGHGLILRYHPRFHLEELRKITSTLGQDSWSLGPRFEPGTSWMRSPYFLILMEWWSVLLKKPYLTDIHSDMRLEACRFVHFMKKCYMAPHYFFKALQKCNMGFIELRRNERWVTTFPSSWAQLW